MEDSDQQIVRDALAQADAAATAKTAKYNEWLRVKKLAEEQYDRAAKEFIPKEKRVYYRYNSDPEDPQSAVLSAEEYEKLDALEKKDWDEDSGFVNYFEDERYELPPVTTSGPIKTEEENIDVINGVETKVSKTITKFNGVIETVITAPDGQMATTYTDEDGKPITDSTMLDKFKADTEKWRPLSDKVEAESEQLNSAFGTSTDLQSPGTKGSSSSTSYNDKSNTVTTTPATTTVITNPTKDTYIQDKELEKKFKEERSKLIEELRKNGTIKDKFVTSDTETEGNPAAIQELVDLKEKQKKERDAARYVDTPGIREARSLPEPPSIDTPASPTPPVSPTANKQLPTATPLPSAFQTSISPVSPTSTANKQPSTFTANKQPSTSTANKNEESKLKVEQLVKKESLVTQPTRTKVPADQQIFNIPGGTGVKGGIADDEVKESLSIQDASTLLKVTTPKQPEPGEPTDENVNTGAFTPLPRPPDVPVMHYVSDSKPNDKKNISEKIKDTDKVFAAAFNNTAQPPTDKKTEKPSTENKYTLSQGPELKTPDWAKSLMALMSPQSDQPPGQQPAQLAIENTIKNQEEIPSIQKPVASSLGLDPRLEKLVRTSLMKGASESGANINYEALLKRINGKLLISQTGNTPQPSREIPLSVDQSPISEQKATNLGQTINNISRSAAKPQLQSTMSGATERALLSMNKSIDKLSTNMQQTNQTLLKSLQTLNSTAIEILKVIPSQISDFNTPQTNMTRQNRSVFKPTETTNEIGMFRRNLGLLQSTYAKNTILPGNKNILS